jgi:hypothetical protein
MTFPFRNTNFITIVYVMNYNHVCVCVCVCSTGIGFKSSCLCKCSTTLATPPSFFALVFYDVFISISGTEDFLVTFPHMHTIYLGLSQPRFPLPLPPS